LEPKIIWRTFVKLFRGGEGAVVQGAKLISKKVASDTATAKNETAASLDDRGEFSQEVSETGA
jgi:hypothetical protein